MKKKIKLSKKNEEMIIKFEKKLKADGKNNKKTLRNYTANTSAVLNLINKDYDKINKNDIVNAFSTDKYSNGSKEIMKAKFRHFLKFIGKNNLAKNIKFNNKALNKARYDEEDILKPEEIKKLVNAPDELNDKALMEIIISSGARRSEIAGIKYGSITIEDASVIIKVDGKTGERRIPLVSNDIIANALPLDNFIKFYRSHRYKEQMDKPFFYSQSHWKKFNGKFMSPQTINFKVDKYSKKAGIKRKISPHLLRHTSATYDGYHFSTNLMCQKYGWTKTSKQLQRYCHESVKMIVEHMLNYAGKSKEKIIRDSICPNCKNKVNIDEKQCSICNYILDLELQYKKSLEKDDEINKYKKLEKEVEELKDNYNNLTEWLKFYLNQRPDAKMPKILTDKTEELLMKEGKLKKVSKEEYERETGKKLRS